MKQNFNVNFVTNNATVKTANLNKKTAMLLKSWHNLQRQDVDFIALLNSL